MCDTKAVCDKQVMLTYVLVPKFIGARVPKLMTSSMEVGACHSFFLLLASPMMAIDCETKCLQKCWKKSAEPLTSFVLLAIFVFAI